MPTFFERPLTWLLVGVFVVFDLFVLSGQIDLSGSVWGGGVILCQLAFMGEWIIRSPVHWLARAAAVCISPASLAWLVLQNVDRDRWDYLLPLCFWLLFSTMAGLGAVYGLRKLLAPKQIETTILRWRFSVMELIGLTLVIAVASWLARDIPMIEIWKKSGLLKHAGAHFLLGGFIALLVGDALKMRLMGLMLASVATLYLMTVETRITLHYQYADIAVLYAMVGAALFIRSFEPAKQEKPTEPVEDCHLLEK